MKRLLTVSILLFPSLLYPQTKININNLEQYGTRMFAPNEDVPYSGLAFDLHRSTGVKKLEGKYRDGIMDGTWTWWYDNGNEKEQGAYKDQDEYGEPI